MARAPHATDIRDAQWIREATHFNAMLFLGRGQYDREDDFPTLAEAKAAVARIEARNPTRNRSALIYAVTAEGRSCLVTAQLEELIMEASSIFGQDYSAKSAAIRALKRSGFEPDQAEIRAEGKRWVIRRPSDPAIDGKTATLIQAGLVADEGPNHPAKRKSPLRAQEDAREQASAAKAQAAASKRAAKATAKPAPAPRRKSDENQPKTRAHYDRSSAKAAPAANAPKRGAKAFEAALEAARAGKLPAVPDFSAETHKPYRAKLARVSELAKAGDAKTLKAETAAWKPYNSSMAPLLRYRDLCLEAMAAKR